MVTWSMGLTIVLEHVFVEILCPMDATTIKVLE
jgi:hypothetical protein